MNLPNAPLISGTTLLTLGATEPEGAAVTYGLIGNYKLKIKSRKLLLGVLISCFFIINIILKNFGTATPILNHSLLKD